MTHREDTGVYLTQCNIHCPIKQKYISWRWEGSTHPVRVARQWLYVAWTRLKHNIMCLRASFRVTDNDWLKSVHTSQDQATFSIRVVYLNRFPIHSVDSVRWSVHEIRKLCGRTHTSPGLVAFGPGKFSQSGVTATTSWEENKKQYRLSQK